MTTYSGIVALVRAVGRFKIDTIYLTFDAGNTIIERTFYQREQNHQTSINLTDKCLYGDRAVNRQSYTSKARPLN